MISLRPTVSYPWSGDALLIWSLRGLAAVAGGIVLLILIFLAAESSQALRQIGVQRFLSDPSWHPLSQRFNLMPMIAGSLAVTAGSLLLAGPLGICSALFCRFYAPAGVAGAYRRMIELLAGIPSVVFGLWGLVVLVPMIRHSLLAGVLVLALMVLPTVALVADAGLAAVPRDYIRGGAALGLTRWGLIRGVILPAARGALVTALILALARAVGETMAVLMVCGNVVQLPGGLFDPVRTLTANIALEMAYAAGTHRSALFFSGLLLMAVVGLLIGAAEMIRRERSRA